MRGHIVKRGKDSYSVVIRRGKDPNTGKYLQSWFTVKGTKKDAEKRLAELLHQLDNGVSIKPGKTTIAEYLQRWLNDYVQPNLSPRTAEGYESIVRCHLVPALGKLTLNQLKPEHIQKYYSEKQKNGRHDGKGALNSRTVRHHHMALHCALEVAVKWGLLSRNCADAVDPPRAQPGEIHTMDEDAIHSLLEAAEATPYYTLFYMALFTGMRRSEILALRWYDVDLLLCQASVNRSLHRLRDHSIVFRQPKTAKGRRLIALTPSNTSVLQRHREKQLSERLLMGVALKEEDLIFSQLDGQPLLPDTVSHAWKKLIKRAGLNSNIRLHDARHTHATLMLKQGVHPKIVQERLGHATIQTTLDIYSHVTPGLQEAAAKHFDEVILAMDKSILKA